MNNINKLPLPIGTNPFQFLQTCNINTECIYVFFKYLNPKDLSSLRGVDKQFRQKVQHFQNAFTFVLTDAKIGLSAHAKASLTKKSAYFEKLFSHTFNENKTCRLTLDNLDLEGLGFIFDSERIEITNDNIEKILNISLYFQVPSLIPKCVFFLKENLIYNQEADLHIAIPLYEHLQSQHASHLMVEMEEWFSKLLLQLFSGDEFNKEILDQIKKLPIKSLNFSNSQIKDKDLLWIQGMPATSLNLSNCKQITAQGIFNLLGMATLKSLDISFCDWLMEEDSLTNLKLLPLEQLILSHLDIPQGGLTFLPSSLKKLDLSHCSGIKIPIALTELQLDTLIVSGCSEEISDEWLQYLPTSLKSLDLTDCEITDLGLEAIKKLSLTSLKLKSDLTPKVTFSALKKLPLEIFEFTTKKESIGFLQEHFTLLKKMKNLKALHLEFLYGSKAPDEKKLITKTLFSLKPLPLKSLNLINSPVIDEQLSSFPQSIEILNLKNSRLLTDVSIDLLPKTLKSLSLDRCKKITGKTFGVLPQSLEFLNVSHCGLTDQALSSLQRLSKLCSLHLSGCKHITNKGILYLKPISSLRRLYLANCSIGDEGLKNLPKFLTTLNLHGLLITNSCLQDLPKTLEALDVMETGIDIRNDHASFFLERPLTTFYIPLGRFAFKNQDDLSKSSLRIIHFGEIYSETYLDPLLGILTSAKIKTTCVVNPKRKVYG